MFKVTLVDVACMCMVDFMRDWLRDFIFKFARFKFKMYNNQRSFETFLSSLTEKRNLDPIEDIFIPYILPIS